MSTPQASYSDLHQQILATPARAQNASPLFGLLPAEIRSRIFEYALTDYPDPSPDKQYEVSSCWARPACFSPPKSDTQLLRTCRAIYYECWFMPFTLREHTHWVTTRDRAPPAYDAQLERITPRDLRANPQNLSQLRFGIQNPMRGDPESRLEVSRMRVFAQMYTLEEGGLATLFKHRPLLPRKLTLTIRHADWWNWEVDQPLYFNGDWIKTTLPASVSEFYIDLESLERKKNQVQEIAKQMVQKWFFKRSDDVVLYGDAKEESRWSGTSTWHRRRWIRDETSPGVIDYYIMTVVFRPENVILRSGRSVSHVAQAHAKNKDVLSDDLKLHRPEWTAMRCSEPYVGQ